MCIIHVQFEYDYLSIIVLIGCMDEHVLHGSMF